MKKAPKMFPMISLVNRWSYVWWFGISFFLMALAGFKYQSLHSTYFDLGIFLNFFYNISQKKWELLVFGHFQPLMYFYSLLANWLPTRIFPMILLSIQALILTWPVVFICKRFGILPASAFTLFFPLWFNALFDFHMDHLAVALLFGFFFLEKSGRRGSAMTLALMLPLVKETFALQTAACGLYLFVVCKSWSRGSILILSGIAIFLLQNAYILPYFSFTDRLSFQTSGFSWMGQNPGEIILFIFSNPLLIMKTIFLDVEKLKYLFYLFAALAFVPLLRPGILLAALPVLGISLLSKEPNHAGLATHYTAGLIAPLIIAFAEGLSPARQTWSRMGLPVKWFSPAIFLVVIAIHIKMSPSPLGILFWNNQSWAYHASAYKTTERDTMIREALETHIPEDNNIAVSAQNSLNWNILARRKYYFSFPDGVLQPHNVMRGSDRSLPGLWNFVITDERTPAETENIWATYAVLDLRRPWYIGHEGCVWKKEKCHENEAFSSRFLHLVQQTKEQFETVFEEDQFFILKRKGT